MKRFFGVKKEVAPGPSLEDVSTRMEGRGDTLEAKVKKCDLELKGIRAKMKKTRKGSSAYRLLQKKAMAVLKRRKMYDKQSGNLQNQIFNMDQTKFAQENLQDTAQMVSAMKQANVALKAQFKEIDIDDIEDLHDDMSDLLDQNEEIQDLMGRSYGLDDDIDETDLEDELAALDDELEMEDEMDETEDTPAYLVSAASAANKEPLVDSMPSAPQTAPKVDQYGMPMQELAR